jgi:hypothetical protein
MFPFQTCPVYLGYIDISILFLCFIAAMWTFVSEIEGLSGYGKSLVDNDSNISIHCQV